MKFEDMTSEQQSEWQAKQGAPLTQASDILSSDIQLCAGLKLISKGDFSNWFNANREALQLKAQHEVYKPERDKETEQVHNAMKAKGIEFLDYREIDWKSMPVEWQVESWRTDPRFGNSVMVEICRPRDQYSKHRQTLYFSELCDNFTAKSVDQLLNRALEATKSLWSKKADQMRRSDTVKKTAKIVSESRDSLESAAAIVADFETRSPVQKAELLQSTEYRNKFMAASKAVKAAKSFR